MQGITLTIGLFLSFLVLTLRPHYALVAYITGLLWYPSELAVSIGTIDITVGRLVVCVLILRCLCDDRIRCKFKWSDLDTWVAVSMMVYSGVTLLTRPSLASIENRGGFIMDSWFAYLVARFIITDRATLISVIKFIGVFLVPLAVLGCIEVLTGWQPFLPLRRFSPWLAIASHVGGDMRWGLARAVGPFSHPILFGGGFAMFLPLIYYLRYQKGYWHNLAYILSSVIVVGALSSLSVGPWVMVMVVIVCLAMEKYRIRSRPILILFVLASIVVEILSDDAFYFVFAEYTSTLGGAGWHRAKLIEVAIRHFGQWWFLGCRGQDPGWGHYFGMSFTDVTNEYILSGVKYGIAGVIVLCGTLATAFRGLMLAYKKAVLLVDKSLYWSLGTALFSVAVAWMSVSFFGQLTPLFYVVLGIIGSSCIFPIGRKIRHGKLLINRNCEPVVHQKSF